MRTPMWLPLYPPPPSETEDFKLPRAPSLLATGDLGGRLLIGTEGLRFGFGGKPTDSSGPLDAISEMTRLINYLMASHLSPSEGEHQAGRKTKNETENSSQNTMLSPQRTLWLRRRQLLSGYSRSLTEAPALGVAQTPLRDTFGGFCINETEGELSKRRGGTAELRTGQSPSHRF